MDKRERIARWNMAVFMLDGTVFSVALAFLQGDTVVSGFIDMATGSATLAGLAATLRNAMFFVGQFILGMYIHRIRVQRRYLILIYCLSRPLLLLTAGVLVAGFRGQAAAWLFLLFYTGFFTLDGLGSLCWTEIMTRTIPSEKRGVVIGLQCTVSGILGLGVGWILRRIMGGAMAPYAQYTLIFALAGLTMLLDIAAMSMVRDVPHESRPDTPSFRLVPYMKRLLPLFNRDKKARAVLVGRMLYLATMISSPINLLFGASVGGLSADQLSMLVYMPVIGQIVSGVVWARLSARKGYPMVMLVSQCVGLAGALCNFVAFFMARAGLPVMIPLCGAMFFIAFNTAGYVGYYQHLIRLVDDDMRPLYLVMSAIVLMPMSFGTTLAGGIAESIGYQYVYIIMLLCGVAGFVLIYKNFIAPEANR